MTSSPDTPASSPVAPDSFSIEPIPGLPGHLVVAHVLEAEKMPDLIDLARLRAVSKGMRKAVAETKRKVEEPSEREAVAKGYLNTVKHMHSRGRLSRKELLCAAAASSGQLPLEELKAMRAENFPWDWETCAIAARRGHLDVLRWAHENGCPWDEKTCEEAAERGDLKMLKWAHENGCPWDADTCANAAWGGNLEMLQWARENGCPWCEQTCANAASCGDLEVLKWARENGCPWDERVCERAAEDGHLEMLQWAIENGAPGSQEYTHDGEDVDFESDEDDVDEEGQLE
jgi:hypothetical protein